jgi:hypothetical protein
MKGTCPCERSEARTTVLHDDKRPLTPRPTNRSRPL